MAHKFSQNPTANIQRSSFDRSHGYKTTLNSGFLIPFYVDEALPGDTFNLKVTAFARLATPLKPVMDDMFMETFFFSVPVRQVWESWEKFQGEQENPDDSTDFVVPQLTISTGDEVGTIFDYMGIPTDIPENFSVNSLHLRAYNHIYNNWFRKQDLIDSVPVNKGDGPDNGADYNLLRRAKRMDYFTACQPWPQKNNTGLDITIPIGTSAPIASDGELVQIISIETPNEGPEFESVIDVSDNIQARIGPQATGPEGTFTPLYADLTQATGITINDMRESFAIQRVFERDSRGGTRYPEIIKSQFNVSDPQLLVLQRPEFLGGSSTHINVQQVPQTSDQLSGGPGAETPQGNLAAYGTGTMRSHGFVKSFTEHCLLIGIINVRASITYQQGLNRMWSRRTRFDYFLPALANLGEQAVLSKEIFLDGSAADEDVFGYIPRFDEYRYYPSLITGEFRSTHSESLDVWHLAQEFETRPVLGETFIQEDPPIDRIIAVQDEPQFILDCHFNLRCARPMPLYAVPGMIDHF